MKVTLKYQIIRFIVLTLFIICCIILIWEAATPGSQSADKSNAVSDTIAKVINNVSEAITKKPKITNLEEFRSYIRKLVGHYGAFLVMGIFACLTGMMFFKYKKWFIYWIKAAVIIIYGFLFAGLTEFIQLYTPQRAGAMSDVFIDFSGYMTSVGIILLIYFFIEYNRFKKEIRNQINETNLGSN